MTIGLGKVIEKVIKFLDFVGKFIKKVGNLIRAIFDLKNFFGNTETV